MVDRWLWPRCQKASDLYWNDICKLGGLGETGLGIKSSHGLTSLKRLDFDSDGFAPLMPVKSYSQSVFVTMKPSTFWFKYSRHCYSIRYGMIFLLVVAFLCIAPMLTCARSEDLAEDCPARPSASFSRLSINLEGKRMISKAGLSDSFDFFAPILCQIWGWNTKERLWKLHGGAEMHRRASSWRYFELLIEHWKPQEKRCVEHCGFDHLRVHWWQYRDLCLRQPSFEAGLEVFD